MGQKNLPNSTKIIEIFESQLKAIKKLDDAIIKGKIDPASVKRVQDFVEPVSKLLKSLSDIVKLTDFINSNKSFLFNIKFKIKFKILMKNIECIANCIESFNKKTKIKENDFKALNDSVKSIKDTLTILKDLIKEVSLVGLMLINPLIYLSLPLIVLFLFEIRIIMFAIKKAVSIKFVVFGKSKRKAIKDSLDTISEVAKQMTLVSVLLINPLVWIGFALIKPFITKIKWLLIYLSRIRINIATLIKLKLLSTMAQDMIVMVGWFALASIAIALLLPILVITIPIFLLTLFLICKGINLVAKISGKALLGVLALSLVAVAIGGLAVSMALVCLLISFIDIKSLLLFVIMLIPLVITLALFGVIMSYAGILIIGACVMLAMVGVSLLIAVTTLALVNVLLKKTDLSGIGELVKNNILMPLKTIVDAVNKTKLIDFVKASVKLMFMVSISFSLLLVALVLKGISNLKFVSEIDPKTGKPTKYELFGDKDFDKAKDNCIKIIQCLADVAKEIDETVNFKAAFKASVKILQLLVIAASVSRIAKILSKMARLEVPEEIDQKTGKVVKWHLMDSKDFETASKNIETIITTLINAISNDDISKKIEDMSAKSIIKIGMVLNAVGNVKNIVDAIQMVSSMIVPEEIDPKTGKILKYKLLKEEDMQKAIDNVIVIMTSFLKAMTDPELEKQIDDMSRRSIEKINQIMETASFVKDLFEAIEKASQFNEDTIGTSMDNIQKLIVTYVNMLNTLFVEKSHIDWYYNNWHDFGFKRVIDAAAVINDSTISALTKTITKFNEVIKPLNETASSIISLANSTDKETIKRVESLSTIVATYVSGVIGDGDKKKGIVITSDANKKISFINAIIFSQKRIEQLNESKLEKNTNNFIKFIDKANSIDTDKIKTVAEMFGKMAEFSESIRGDFDKLADILNEKLVDLLEKIHVAITDNNGEGAGSGSGSGGSANNNGMVTPVDQNKDKKDKVDLTGIENELTEILSEIQNISNKRW